jgi:UDP-N-acetylmuramoylalanine--D-glutamate ligase
MDELTADLSGRAILVVGAGVTGRALKDFCLARGAKVSLLDELADDAVRVVPEVVDLAIVSPGWRSDHLVIKELKSKSIPLMSEIDFAWRMKKAIAPHQKWVALTGTNGKTTTIQMVESILHAAGIRGVACGNVGRTVIESIDPELDVLAIELSSFQIAWSDEPLFDEIAILNISPDHIDWHGSFEAYRDAKLKLISLSRRAFLNIGDATLSRVWPQMQASGREVIGFHLGTPGVGEVGLVEELIVDRALVSDPMSAEVLVEVDQLPSRAPHNIANAMAAAMLAKSLGASHEAISSGLKSFALDHHRLQIVGEFAGVRWVDDSKATNPHAAMAALFSFPSVIWIAGGLAKGAQMDELVRATHSHIRAAILIGTDAPLIREELRKVKPEIKIVEVDPGLRGKDVMDKVVLFAKNLASKGDTVLLAPACASMDQFSSYKERGELFQSSIRELVAGERPL